jgi:hypothetical protein
MVGYQRSLEDLRVDDMDGMGRKKAHVNYAMTFAPYPAQEEYCIAF